MTDWVEWRSAAMEHTAIDAKQLMRPLRHALQRRVLLSREERRALRSLREGYCNEAFDPASAETSRQLLTIWGVAFPEWPLSSSAPGEHWKRLGFQAATPCTDVRAGRLALDQLHYLTLAHPERMRNLAVEAESMGYPFACGCFNVTQVVAQFFGLYLAQAVMPVGGTAKASPRQLRHFARLCSEAPGGPRYVLDELFCSLVELLHKHWRKLHSEGRVNLMDFPVVLTKVHAAHAAFWQRQPKGVTAFRDLLEGDSRSQPQAAAAKCPTPMAPVGGSEVELMPLRPRTRLQDSFIKVEDLDSVFIEGQAEGDSDSSEAQEKTVSSPSAAAAAPEVSSEEATEAGEAAAPLEEASSAAEDQSEPASEGDAPCPEAGEAGSPLEEASSAAEDPQRGEPAAEGDAQCPEPH